jgi:alpha-1,6-mannosyltransferase
LKCEARDVRAAAVLVLAFALSRGMILGRAASDLLFYGCALAQAALAIFGARLAVRRGACVLAVLIVGATLIRLAFVFQAPTLSGDVYRYIWDGRVIDAGFNPYLHVPADPALTPSAIPISFI